jgi:pyruvate dehydrogenase (quinone)/pyruvate oxidase
LLSCGDGKPLADTLVEQRFSLSGALCTMGAGLAYAIGAQSAFPERQVVALVGDGAASMFIGDLATLRQQRLPVKIIVLKNNSVVLERWEQLSFLGNPEYGNDLVPTDFVKIAEACGNAGSGAHRGAAGRKAVHPRGDRRQNRSIDGEAG